MSRTDGTLDFTAGSRAMQDRAMTDTLQHMDVRVQADEPNDEVAPFMEPGQIDFGFAASPPPAAARRMVNATWRMLEEQRVNALEIVADCEAEIAKWTTKRDDAMRAADMCLAGQNGGE